ncbi:MAG TPA: Tol-Pal system beta propeller repeat protein TolB [Myxococcales bacterium]|nr:Tol-Pal system beta propeller repeat protein TolB [Myxococcales bacterium]
MKRLLFFALAAGAAAHAQRPSIDIRDARVQAYPIALAPSSGAPEGADVLEVLASDFDRSGLFRLLDPRSFLADPAKEGSSASTIDFSKWTAIGAQALVKSVAKVEGDTVKVEFRLFDVPHAAELLRGEYSAPRAGLRQIAHRFGDDVVRSFTQDPGVFQTRIAYVRETENGKQIVVSDADGYGPQQITSGSINLLPSWMPDGKSLAFTSFREGGGAHLFQVDLSTRAVQPLVKMGDFATGAVFSPDGIRFAFSSSKEENTDIWISPIEGGILRRVTDSRGIDISASWSPDGRRIAFVSDRAGTPQIYTMAMDGSDVRRITFQGNYNQEPAWSPKGDLIAFSGRDEHRVFDLYTVNVQTGKVTRLTQNEGTNEKPSWAPNGRLIVYSSTRSGKKQLWTILPDGSNARQVTNEQRGASDPAWGPLPRR